MAASPERSVQQTNPSPTLAAASAIAQASRRRIAEVLAENPRGLGVTAIAQRVGLHHNAVRQHLQRLADAGVVAATREEPRGRGRPRMLYTLVDPAAPRIAAQQELVRLLVGLLARTGASGDDAEAFGRGQAAGLSAGAGAEGIVETFARLGFSPRETSGAGDAARGRLALRLDHCPFQDAVRAPGGQIVCRLHRGLTAGIVERSGPAAALAAFEPRDPATAGCVVAVEGLAAAPPRG